ncbi:MAG: prepilin peptidase, partial [Deltaproteobacteria bacterium]|nr:prepilin peptidase [Deltaproteobacteria bacterium]
MPLLTAPYGEILAAMFGLIVGSFLNVVIHRMPLEQSIVKPRSYCPQCKHPIRWYDNIPLLSYLMLRGKCRDCQQAISIRYLLVEVLTGLVSLQTFLFFNRSPFFYFAYFCLLLAPLLAVIFIDLRHRIIPNAISLPGILVGTAVHYLDAPPGWELRTLLDSVIGILAGGGFLFLVAFAYEKIRKKEGLVSFIHLNKRFEERAVNPGNRFVLTPHCNGEKGHSDPCTHLQFFLTSSFDLSKKLVECV